MQMEMKSNRRSVLRFLGLTPVTAPIAARAASDKAIADLVGVSSFPNNGAPAPSYIGGSPDTDDTWKSKVMRFLAHNALPEWIEDELRERHRHVGFLDPDIACKRSWSMSVKLATQRERNIARAKIDALDGPRRGLRAREFEEKFGVWL